MSVGTTKTEETFGPISVGAACVVDAMKTYSVSQIAVFEGGTETLCTPGIDYTLTIEPDFSGVTVTPLAPLVARVSAITVARRTPLTSDFDIAPDGRLSEPRLVEQLDRTLMREQENAGTLARAIKVPAGEAGLAVLPAVADRAGHLLGFDSEGGLVTAEATGVLPGTVTADSLAPFAVQDRAALDYKVFSLRAEGAKGDGVDDDTAAITAWLARAGDGVVLVAEPGTYRFTSPIVSATNGKNFIAIRGAGPYQTVFEYDGADTTVDLITLGSTHSDMGAADPSEWNSTFAHIEGFRITSKTQMTAGKALRFNKFSDSFFRHIVVGGMDFVPAVRNLWDGFWFNGVHIVHLEGFAAYTQHDGILVNGIDAVSNANLFLHSGYSDFCGRYGVHIAGNFGGLFGDMVECLGNAVANWAITTEIAANPREIIFGVNTVADGLQTTALYGFLIDCDGANGSVIINSFVGSSVQHGVYVKKLPLGVVNINAGRVFNNLGHGVLIDDATTTVNIGTGCVIGPNAGWGVYASVATTKVRCLALMQNNTLGDISGNIRQYKTSVCAVSSLGGALGGGATASVEWFQLGPVAFFTAVVAIPDNGTGNSAVQVSLPFTPRQHTIATGRARNISGKQLQAAMEPGVALLRILAYDNTYPAVSGEQLIVSGQVEIY